MTTTLASSSGSTTPRALGSPGERTAVTLDGLPVLGSYPLSRGLALHSLVAVVRFRCLMCERCDDSALVATQEHDTRLICPGCYAHLRLVGLPDRRIVTGVTWTYRGRISIHDRVEAALGAQLISDRDTPAGRRERRDDHAPAEPRKTEGSRVPATR